jgi:hypothetical protein
MIANTTNGLSSMLMSVLPSVRHCRPHKADWDRYVDFNVKSALRRSLHAGFAASITSQYFFAFLATFGDGGSNSWPA